MSVKILGACFGLDLPANSLLTLMAMADHADHDGNNIYPSIALLAWKVNLSESTVRRHIHKLLKRGYLQVMAIRPGKTTLYRIDPSHFQYRKRDEPLAPCDPCQGDTPTTAMVGESSYIKDSLTNVNGNGATPRPETKPMGFSSDLQGNHFGLDTPPLPAEGGKESDATPCNATQSRGNDVGANVSGSVPASLVQPHKTDPEKPPDEPSSPFRPVSAGIGLSSLEDNLGDTPPTSDAADAQSVSKSEPKGKSSAGKDNYRRAMVLGEALESNQVGSKPQGSVEVAMYAKIGGILAKAAIPEEYWGDYVGKVAGWTGKFFTLTSLQGVKWTQRYRAEYLLKTSNSRAAIEAEIAQALGEIAS